jgi:hypothetical protein
MLCLAESTMTLFVVSLLEMSKRLQFYSCAREDFGQYGIAPVQSTAIGTGGTSARTMRLLVSSWLIRLELRWAFIEVSPDFGNKCCHGLAYTSGSETYSARFDPHVQMDVPAGETSMNGGVGIPCVGLGCGCPMQAMPRNAVSNNG